MVATCYFLDQTVTFFTFLDIRCVLPILYLLSKGPLTTCLRVTLSVASIAYLSRAFRALACFFG